MTMPQVNLGRRCINEKEYDQRACTIFGQEGNLQWLEELRQKEALLRRRSKLARGLARLEVCMVSYAYERQNGDVANISRYRNMVPRGRTST